mgnify:CR=1 FL=1
MMFMSDISFVDAFPSVSGGLPGVQTCNLDMIFPTPRALSSGPRSFSGMPDTVVDLYPTITCAASFVSGDAPPLSEQNGTTFCCLSVMGDGVALTATSLNSPTAIMDYLYHIVCTDFFAAIKSSSRTLTNCEVVSSVGHSATRAISTARRPSAWSPSTPMQSVSSATSSTLSAPLTIISVVSALALLFGVTKLTAHAWCGSGGHEWREVVCLPRALRSACWTLLSTSASMPRSCGMPRPTCASSSTPPSPSSRSCTRPSRFGRLSTVVLLLSVTDVSSVCVHCKDTIEGCRGGNLCPLVVDVTANQAIFESDDFSAAPNLQHLLPSRLLHIFTRSVSEFLAGLSAAPAGGRAVDFSEAKYNNPGAIVKASYFGHCTAESAMIELMRRMDGAGDADALARLKMAIEVLKTRGETVINAGVGFYTFVWAKVSMFFHASSSLRIASSSVSNKASTNEMTATLRRPESSTEFFEMLMLFVQVIAALGIAHFSIVMNFISDVVYKSMRELQLTWQQAHELLLCYFNEIETDVSKTLNLGNVFGRGKHDSLLSQAKINTLLFFRTRVGTAQPGSATTSTSSVPKTFEWNGKCNGSAGKCCVPWNLNKLHPASHLAGDGTCIFIHECMQYVTDKGPGGQCRGNHKRAECNYPRDKRCSQPVK